MLRISCATNNMTINLN